jgi:hypothetical protein
VRVADLSAYRAQRKPIKTGRSGHIGDIRRGLARAIDGHSASMLGIEFPLGFGISSWPAFRP